MAKFCMGELGDKFWPGNQVQHVNIHLLTEGNHYIPIQKKQLKDNWGQASCLPGPWWRPLSQSVGGGFITMLTSIILTGAYSSLLTNIWTLYIKCTKCCCVFFAWWAMCQQQITQKTFGTFDISTVHMDVEWKEMEVFLQVYFMYWCRLWYFL